MDVVCLICIGGSSSTGDRATHKSCKTHELCKLLRWRRRRSLTTFNVYCAVARCTHHQHIKANELDSHERCRTLSVHYCIRISAKRYNNYMLTQFIVLVLQVAWLKWLEWPTVDDVSARDKCKQQNVHLSMRLVDCIRWWIRCDNLHRFATKSPLASIVHEFTVKWLAVVSASPAIQSRLMTRNDDGR